MVKSPYIVIIIKATSTSFQSPAWSQKHVKNKHVKNVPYSTLVLDQLSF